MLMKRGLKPLFLASLALASASFVAGCSGANSVSNPGSGSGSGAGAGSGSSSGTRFTVGGTVSGLSGTGLVLQDNGGDNLTISANGAFTFATKATAYNVTVLTQPTNPPQTCTVTGGS